MNQLIQELIGKQVRVETTRRIQDIGILEAYDHPFLKIRKHDGKLLYFPVYKIRLVEPY